MAKKAKTKWTFPRATIEQAQKIPYVLKDHNGGNPWEPESIRTAIGAGTGGNAFFYLTSASRDYGRVARVSRLLITRSLNCAEGANPLGGWRALRF